MKVYFGQVYIEPGVSYPLSHHFQRRLSKDVSSLVVPSELFLDTYGRDYKLMFNVSAKSAIDESEIRGPAVFKKTKDVEYTIFLPFDVIATDPHPIKGALTYLLRAVRKVLASLEIETARILEQEDRLIAGICSDPKMFLDQDAG